MLSRHLSHLKSGSDNGEQSNKQLPSNRLLEHIHECALVLNPDGIINNFNDQGKCQFNPEVGTAISVYLKSEHMAWLKSCMLGECQDTRELQFFNGSAVTECLGECIPVPGEEKFILILKNVNEVPEELIFSNVFNKAIHGLLIVDEDGFIIRSNVFANKLLHLQDHKKENIDHLLNDYETKRNIPGFIQQLAPHTHRNMASQVVIIDSRNYEFTKITNVAVGYHLFIIRDITEIFEYIKRSDQQDTLKVVGQLAAGIAHEIRNPMTSLKGFIQLLESDLGDTQKMYFDVINSELSRLESTITEFLMLAKPKNSLMKKIDLRKVLEETVNIMQPQALLHDIELTFTALEEELFIFGDANRLKQVFINLIKNAVEASPARGKIGVSIEEKNKDIIASVSDNGCGIPEEKLKKLNEPFFTTKENGTGLGLPVSLRIIEEHRGSVEVISREGTGTRFNISLPVTGK
ncbi:ATP-binding protein [Jeotgalibacillus sp. JSM ZJ347]|uniref:ATP-binding protein n=1 Tax=Jeotgalibacillus sp. JSM ZJ347 TaxID=3342117 RepID=UPI0035A93F26